jgi:hypothetical protein
VTGDRPQDVLLSQEALQLVTLAGQRGCVLRLMGALAIERRCPKSWGIAKAAGRSTADIDLMGRAGEWQRLIDVFENHGYELDERHAMLHGKERLNFFHHSGYRVDVFLDKLTMCHDIDLRRRLEIHPETLSLADLLLQKLQIVELTHKDVIDMFVLLREHEVGGDESVINALYIASLLGIDWGFYHTAMQNLIHVKDESIFEVKALTEEDRGVVLKRIEVMAAEIEAHPKSFAWKVRAKLGTRMRWYREVGDLVR